tara:strand:+ start:602 stop:1222 length:621 start_codon:yes stop_codon:yes gene_type:complete
MKFKTDQENFWSGKFGDEYIGRNQNTDLLTSNINFFINALKGTKNIKNCIEFGANIGMNIKALKIIFPKIDFYALEINKTAAEHLAKVIPKKNIFEESILDFQIKEKWDLTLIKGVLIHINPDEILKVYKKLFESTNKYLLICEYYSRNPETLIYRGFQNKLFKRDFAGEMLDLYPNLYLLDYGFVYHKDQKFPQDDITWFLLEKN